MNFFEHQAAARRSTLWLVALFALAVAGIVAAVDIATFVATGSGGAVVLATALTLAVIALGSLYRIISLRGGGEAVALQMGGVPVPEDTTDLNLRRLRNVVEEIAIASGVPMPRIYVLEHEAAINAFAAGYSTSDAVVAVTRGALDRLNRDELQGVVAHEFSHILNGDMRLNIRLMGVLFGILMIGLIGREILRHGRGGGRGRDAAVIFTVALVAMSVGYIGLFFGRMIKAGVSRSREMLADASAVQFTRQTQGLSGALKKIGGIGEGSQLGERGNAEEVSHLLFGDGVGFRGLFATHPPLLKRIQALEPAFKGEDLARLQAAWLGALPDGMQEDIALGLVGDAVAPLPGVGQDIRVTPSIVSQQVATPRNDDYRRAEVVATAIPEALRELAGKRDMVMPVLLALLLDGNEDVAAHQQQAIHARLGAEVADAAIRIHQQLTADLHPALRLPLAALAFPVLRLRPRPELEEFLATVSVMIQADRQVSLFEYCLARLLRVQVQESLDPARHVRFGRRKLHAVRGEVAMLLSVVAQAGHDNEVAARKAYLAGMQQILPGDVPPYQPPANGVQALDAVWGPLDALDPMAKQGLVEALTATIAHDDRISVSEAELLRTLCGVFHCPLPPVLGE